MNNKKDSFLVFLPEEVPTIVLAVLSYTSFTKGLASAAAKKRNVLLTQTSHLGDGTFVPKTSI